MKFSRHWAMPTADIFQCEPIKGFVQKYLLQSTSSVDPFARNSRLATLTNDLNPNTSAGSHMEALEFIRSLRNVSCDLVLFDPPYSYRQAVECYESVGRSFTFKDNQQVQRWTEYKDALLRILTDNSVVLSFGWNSTGMGAKRGFALEEILLVNHGSAHNDTICIAERRLPQPKELL